MSEDDETWKSVSPSIAGLSRRGMMRALAVGGVGSAVASGTVAADETAPTEDGSGSSTLAQVSQVDASFLEGLFSWFGLPLRTGEDEAIAQLLQPDHVVEGSVQDLDRVFSEDVVGGEDTMFPDFPFDPVGVLAEPGDIIRFNMVNELHTVTAYHPRFGYQQRIPDGVPGFSSPPLLPDSFWLYEFTVPGVYDILCLPHEGLGMVMRVVVTEEDGSLPEAPPLVPPEEGGPSETSAAVLETDALTPENIAAEGTVAWTDLPELGFEPPI